jgi:hypothetical protein
MLKGMWMSIKATLQIELTNLYGERDGLIFYKAVLAQIIEIICSKCMNSQQITSDVKFQVIKKLSRRIKKLRMLETYNAKCQHIVDNITNKSTITINKLRQLLNEEFELTIEDSKFSASLDMEKISMSDIKHDDPKVFDELNRLAAISDNGSQFAQPKPLKFITRVGSTFEEIIKSLSSCGSVIPLHDIENWSLDHSLDGINSSSLLLYNLLKQYTTNAFSFYQNDDPMGYSRLILTSLKLVCVLDKIAINEFPMLIEHKIGFDSKPLECLLLPLQTQIKCAYEVKKYIDQRNDNGFDPSLVDFTTESSYFGAKYAKTDLKMIALKEKILKEIDEKIREKHNEVESARKEYSRLMKKSNSLSHTYFTDTWGQQYHDYSCHKCRLSEEAAKMKVEIYEKYLPDEESRRNLVVFELQIVESIRCLRDAIYILKTNILKVVNQNNQECKGLWPNYNKIASHALYSQENISFGSTTKLFEVTHYKCLHPNSDLGQFIVPNGYNFNLCLVNTHVTLKYDESSTGYKKYCVFKAAEPYGVLQFTLESCKHTENQIIAIKNKCPADLTMNEFVTYGFHRAGSRLQLKNLLSSLVTRKNLTLSHQAVLFLITQSLYELESFVQPFFYSKNIYPMAHVDFADSHFCVQLADALDDLVELSSKKWNDHLLLLTIIEVVSRSISMAPNEHVLKRMVDIMRSARRISIQWQRDVQKVINELQKKQSNAHELAEIQILNMKCLEVACFGVLSFYTELDKRDLLMNSNEDILDWLTLVAVTTNYDSLYGNDFLQSSTFLINLLRRVKIVISFVETQYYRILKESAARPLNDYVASIWPILKNGKILQWKQLNAPLQEWHEAKFILNSSSNQPKTLQIGINGEFLVDSQPVGRLPNEILKHPLYLRYFLDFKNFIVYPSSTYGTYVTSNNGDGGVNYEFNLYESDLVISETHKEDEEKLQLIPHEKFDGFFPPLLVDDYSHWLNKSKERVVLRDKSFSETFRCEHYVFDVAEKILYEPKNGDKFFFIQSKTFEELEHIITSRLEMKRYVHVVLKSDNKCHSPTEVNTLNKSDSSQIWIMLPRMSLSFHLQKDRVVSKDFSGFEVEQTQHLKTLTGLRKGLILTEVKEIKSCLVKKKLLVPHGKIIVNSGDKHQKIDIDCTEVSEKKLKPTFFSYDVDSRQKVLRCDSLTSRLYLACLHAYTSSIFSDPFLEQTGTERALTILQSGSCWSMKSFGREEKAIMKCIATLSPQREYYPKHLKHMETIRFKEHVPSLVAHNGFRLLVNKLIADSERLETAKDSCIDDKNDFLWMRAYNRNLNFYNLGAQLSLNFERQVIRQASTLDIMPTFTKSLSVKRNKNFLLFNVKLSQRVREVKERQCAKLNGDVKLIEYVLSSSTLKGKSQNKLHSFNISNWFEMSNDLRNNWLDLYDYARLSSRNCEHKIKLTMLLSLISYENSSIPIDLLVFFKTVASHPEEFFDVAPPTHESYYDLQSYAYDSFDIKAILKRNFVTLDTYETKNSFSFSTYSLSKLEIHNLKEKEYESVKLKKIEEIENFYSSYKETLIIYYNYNIDKNYFEQSFHDEVNECFKKWRQNRELRIFLNRLQSIHDGVAIINSFRYVGNEARKFSKIKNFYKFKVNKKIIFDMSTNEKEEKNDSIFDKFMLQKNEIFQSYIKNISTKKVNVKNSFFLLNNLG